MISERSAAVRSSVDNRTQDFRNGAHTIRCERFAHDDIVGDCVVRGVHLSAFAACEKAQNSVDGLHVPVQRAFRDTNINAVVAENIP